MTERPYRSGALRLCLICRQTQEIRETVISMVEDHTYNEISQWLATQEIAATWSQVRYFINQYSTKLRRYTIQPKKTYHEKLTAYIDELLKYKGDTYTIHVLHLYGSSWTAVTTRLHSTGLIHPLRQYPPIQWQIVGTKDEIREWYESEVKRVLQHR